MPLLFGMGLAELLEVLGPWITRLAIAHMAGVAVKAMGALGIAWYTETEIIQPLLDNATQAMNTLPGSITVWIGAFGGDKVASILIGAYTVSVLKHLFLGKSA